jgi:hypothetical protein
MVVSASARLSLGAIIGMAVAGGVVSFAACVAVVACCVVVRRRHPKSAGANSDYYNNQYSVPEEPAPPASGTESQYGSVNMSNQTYASVRVTTESVSDEYQRGDINARAS